MGNIRIRKCEGRKVRRPDTCEPLADGTEYLVEDSVFWRRRIQSGDVEEILKPAAKSAAKPKKDKPEAPSPAGDTQPGGDPKPDADASREPDAAADSGAGKEDDSAAETDASGQKTEQAEESAAQAKEAAGKTAKAASASKKK